MTIAGKRSYVTDASVILKWFTSGGESELDKALQLRDDYQNRHINLYAPELLIYEIANVLRYKETLTAELISRAISSIYDMDIVLPVYLPVMITAVAIARKYGITVYDSTYVSFAQITDCPLITADKKLFGKIKALPRTLFISEYVSE